MRQILPMQRISIHRWQHYLGASVLPYLWLVFLLSYLVLPPESGEKDQVNCVPLTIFSSSVFRIFLFMWVDNWFSCNTVLLVSQLIAIIGYIIVLANDKSMTYLYVGRAIHGLGMSGLEYLVTSTIGDLFFVHQRAFHIGLWHFGLGTGNTCGQVIGAQIVSKQNWHWAFSYAWGPQYPTLTSSFTTLIAL